ncbi:MAG: dihydroorotase family protein [Candidatus Freyarchaeota archaeon]|nr:dihydroorotase family protein [Candidatus Jordarchaeia archaeon]
MRTSTVDLVLKNSKIFTYQGIISGGLAVKEGKIHKFLKEPELLRSDKTIDAKGHLLLPGIIDPHVHLRDLQLSYKEDFYTGTCAAATGGITTVLDMPNTIPRTSSLKALREKKREAEKKIVVNVAFYAGFPKDINEVKQIAEQGIAGFKIYPHDPMEEINFQDEKQICAYFRAAAENNLPVLVHPDNLETIKTLQSELEKQKRPDIEVFLGSHPATSEAKAITRYSDLGVKTGCRLHICHVSSSESVVAIKGALEKGARLTCEVTPHHLLLTSEEIRRQGALAKVLPPLRSRDDNVALWAAVLDGVINVIASDHAPHSLSEKEKPFPEAPSGFPGLETLLPLMLTKVARGDLRLEKLVDLTSRSPAKIFKLENKGMLLEGYDADMVLVDLKEKWRISPEKFHSKSKFSPFKNWNVVGKVRMTFIKGVCVMSDEEILVPRGFGKVINVNQ